MSQDTKPNGVEDPQNSENEKEESEKKWQNFKDFTRAIFSVKPEELENPPPEGEEEEGNDDQSRPTN